MYPGWKTFNSMDLNDHLTAEILLRYSKIFVAITKRYKNNTLYTKLQRKATSQTGITLILAEYIYIIKKEQKYTKIKKIDN